MSWPLKAKLGTLYEHVCHTRVHSKIPGIGFTTDGSRSLFDSTMHIQRTSQRDLGF